MTRKNSKTDLRLRNLHEVAANPVAPVSQRSRFARTLEFVAQPLCPWKSLVVILALCSLGFGQSETTIAGHITDEKGAVIAGAVVRLTSREGRQLVSTTDLNGAFRFTDLSPGEYLFEIRAEGFSAFVSGEVRLDRGKREDLEFELKVAGVSASVVVTATGTAQRADEVSKGFSLLDSQEIENKKELTLSEALRGIPGLRVQQQGSPGALTTLRLRGQRNFDTAILLDGLRVRDASDINGSAVSLISDLVPVGMARLEILRGSGSSIYGTNAVGGVINIVPETGSGSVHFEIGAEGGGLSTFRERIRALGGGRRFGYSLGLNRLDVRRGVDGNDEYGNSAGSGRFHFNLTPAISLAANFFGTIANARVNDSPFALAGAFGTAQPFPLAVVGSNFQPDFNNPDQGRRNRLLIGSVKLSQQVSEAFSYTIAYQRVSSRRRNYNGPRIDPQFASFLPFGDFEFTSTNEGTTDTLDARFTARFGRSNLATGGFEFEHESSLQQFIPSFGPSNNEPDKQRTFALFGQDQVWLFDDSLQLSLGVRGQFYRIRAADRPGVLRNLTPKTSITGDAALAYFIHSTGTKLRAHVGNGFRAPALFERFGTGAFPGVGFTRFGDPTLKVEQSISVDAGFDQRLAKDRLVLGATFFYTKLQRVIVFTGFSPDPLGLGRLSGFANQPGGLARGFEGFVETKPLKGTQLRSSYTYTNSDRSVTGRGLQPEYVIPRHTFGLTLNQRFRSFAFNLDVNRTGSYIAPVFENEFPFRVAELRFRGYTKADLFASYERRMSETVTAVVFGGADNILNQKYFENGFGAPGIVGRGGISFKF
jgi:iron complex outermembrane receptor protein